MDLKISSHSSHLQTEEGTNRLNVRRCILQICFIELLGDHCYENWTEKKVPLEHGKCGISLSFHCIWSDYKISYNNCVYCFQCLTYLVWKKAS